MSAFIKKITRSLPRFNHPVVFSVVPFLIILLLTIFIFRHAFAQPGMFPTHDGEFHIIRSLHFFSELRRGQFPVRMVPELAFQYGYPVFHFFYPLPYYVTAVFQLVGLSAADGWRCSLVLITFLSLWVFYKWLKTSFTHFASLVGTVLFALVPYRFLTLYVTGQIGGYYSLLLAPMIGLGLHHLLQDKKTSKNKNTLNQTSRSQVLGGMMVAIGVAGMILSHLLSVIIFFIPLTSYAVYLLSSSFSKEKLGKLMLWLGLGVTSASFYLLPFLWEKSWVRLGRVILINHRDHWPSFRQLVYSPWGYGYSQVGIEDGMSFQVGLAVLVVWLLTFILLIFQQVQKRKKKQDNQAILFLVITAVLFFLMLEFSAVIWQVFSPLQYLQYPWRVLASTSVCGAWLAGWLVNQFSNKKQLILGVFLVLLALINVRNYARPWPLSWKTDLDLINSSAFSGSTDISWELMPAEVNIEPHQLSKTVTADNLNAVISQVERPTKGKTRLQTQVVTDEPTLLTLPIWNFPVWQVRVNERIVDKQTNQEGAIQVRVPSGTSIVKVDLVRTKLQKLADTISFFSIGLLLFAVLRLLKLKLR